MFIEVPKNSDLQSFILSYDNHASLMKMLVFVAANSSITLLQGLMGLNIL